MRGGYGIRIKGFSVKRDLVPYLLGVVGITMCVVGGVWDGLVAVVVALAIAGSGTLKRVEWKGRTLAEVLGDRSVFEEGLRALPADVATLTTIALALPAAAVAVVLITGTAWAWVGVGINALISLLALAAIVRELRRRRFSSGAGDGGSPPIR